MAKNPTLEDCFHDCKTGRIEQARVLTDLLINKHERLKASINRRKGDANTFSLNIDASWGMGKTFFIERWAEFLGGQGHLTLMFNAWKHDYSKDAITSLLSALHSQIDERTRAMDGVDESKTKVIDQLDKVGDAIKGIFKKSLPAGLAAVSKAYLGFNAAQFLTNDPENSQNDELAMELMGALGNATAKQMLESSKVYEDSIEKFVEAMNQLVGELDAIGGKLPIFVFIDDLDRCRPNYAVEILECVKHVLGIDSVYFVFTTDTEQLCHTLEGAYGGGFDAKKYLKRVFNRDCVLSEPDHFKFAQSLFESALESSSPSYDLSKILVTNNAGKISKPYSYWFSKISEAAGAVGDDFSGPSCAGSA